jgi:hypothetical protein
MIMHNTKFFIGILSFMLLAGAGCTTAVGPIDDGSTDGEVSGYYGDWERTSMLVDGEVYQDGSISSLSVEGDSFVNIINDCTYSGDIVATDLTLALTVVESNCEILEGYETTVFDYTVSDSGEELVTSMDFFGSELINEYSRVE